MSKKCSKCGVVKDESKFHKDRSKPDGLNCYCKECKKAYGRNRRQKKREDTGGLYKAWDNAKVVGVCEEWEDFDTFYKWAEPRQADGLELSRADTSKPFSPDNCKFMTREENLKNAGIAKLDRETVDKIRETYFDFDVSQKEIAEHYNVEPETIWRILHNKTW